MNESKKEGSRTKAVALKYDRADELPRVLASGIDEIARHILKIAELNNVPIHKDSELTEMLSKVAEGDYISQESYGLVAEIISFLYEVDQEWQLQKASA